MDHTLERNQQTVLDFYEIGLNQKDFDKAADLIGSRYVQHNPRIADCEYVVAHMYGVHVPGQPGTAIVDRLDADGKIVEHWDVMQPVPDTAANQNGMF
ncbi:nuclear transport factor 2 family protein [Kribbella sp. CWNU-51]